MDSTNDESDHPIASGSVTSRAPVAASDLVPALSDASHELAQAVPVQTMFYTLKMTASGRKYDLKVASTDTIHDLKESIWSLCGVAPERQKILGLVKGKLPQDHESLETLGLFEGKAISCLGTPHGQEIQRGNQGSDILDDLDVDFATALLRNPALDDRNKRRIIEATAKLALNVIHEPRPGKRLCVLDLDGTLMDVAAFQDDTIHAIDMARPGLDDFLTALYPHYDLVIWSQTSWKWLESKLVELNMVGHDHDRYQISFVLDRAPMIKVSSLRDGKPYTHEVKALSIIWAKYPELYSAKNSVHIDDLGRNFVMNPGNGIKCRAFKNARKHRDDRELLYLQRYLLQLLDEPDLSAVDHSNWRKRPGIQEA